MKLTIEINGDSAAFLLPYSQEFTRILLGLAEQIAELPCESGKLKDINGNTVGFYKMDGIFEYNEEMQSNRG